MKKLISDIRTWYSGLSERSKAFNLGALSGACGVILVWWVL